MRRRGAIAMNYPRRRAPIACNFCRQRKRKCDGRKPACALCSAAGITCDYHDGFGPSYDSSQLAIDERSPTDRTGNNDAGADAGSGRRSQSAHPTTSDLMRRIEELESLVRKQNANEQSEVSDRSVAREPTPPRNLPQSEIHISPPSFDHSVISSIIPPFQPLPSSQSYSFLPRLDEINFETLPRPDDIDEEPLTIPINHLTPTGSLFSIEPIQRLIGEYPEDYFFQIESTREFVPHVPNGSFEEALVMLNLDKSHMDSLLTAFFSEIHPHFPIFDPDQFTEFFNNSITNRQSEVDVVLCLVVLALGKLACNRQAYSPGQYTGDDGADYFSLAYRTLTMRWITCFSSDLSLMSGLVFSAIYLCYLERPLHAWKLVYMASSKLQLMVSMVRTEPLSQEETDYLGRLCWTCFLIECDSLAEFHLPRSGIELIIDRMPFPCFTDRTNPDGLSFLAICSIRRLLNRIHRAIYSTDTGLSQPVGMANDLASRGPSSHPLHPIFTVASLGSVCAELTRQLDVWYNSLPEAIKPDLSEPVPRNLHDGWLRLRYWSAKHIICRPCLVYAATLTELVDMPPHVMEYAKRCIESCRQYILTSSYVLMERTQYTWMTIQASLACAFVIAIASGSALLNTSVPDASELLKKVIAATQRWASPGSSSESIGWILSAIFQKQRFLRKPPRSSFSTTSSARSSSFSA